MTQTVQHHKEPLLRIVKRDGITRPKAYAIRIVAVLASLVVSGISSLPSPNSIPFRSMKPSSTGPSAPTAAPGSPSGTP